MNKIAIPKLTVSGDFDRPEEGYIVVAPLSSASKRNIQSLQEKIAEHFPESSLWLPKDEQLHITFAHAISPDKAYLMDRKDLIKLLEPDVITFLKNITNDHLCIEVDFDAVELSPSAIIIKGRDDGSYAALRKMFTDKIKLPKETRMPPTIIHSTIARFREELDYEKLRRIVEGLTTSFQEKTTELHFIHEQKIYVQEHSIIAKFPERK